MQSNRGSLVRILLALLALASLVASDAMAARKVRATGFFRNNVGQINLPLQFVLSGMPGGHSVHLGFPNGDPMVDGDALLVGKSPASISLPTGLINAPYSAILPLMGSMNVQISSMFTVFVPVTGGGMFSAGGGPGAFSFCPGTIPGLPGAACPTTAGTAGTGFMMGGAPNLMAAPQGTGTRNGRLIYLGGGGFGGTSQLFLTGTGQLTAPRPGFGFGSPIFQAQQMELGGGALRATGAGFGYVIVRTGMAQTYSQPKTAPTTAGIITSAQFGPMVTSMNALTSCPSTTMGGAYPNIPLTGTLACVSGTGMLLTATPGGSSITGFPFTTGTVLLQNSTNTAANGVGDYVSLTGSDARTARGIGNITMVAGTYRGTFAANSDGPPFNQVWSLTISEKTPSMTPGGLAAAALLIVLGTGYAARRRF